MNKEDKRILNMDEKHISCKINISNKDMCKLIKKCVHYSWNVANNNEQRRQGIQQGFKFALELLNKNEKIRGNKMKKI